MYKLNTDATTAPAIAIATDRKEVAHQIAELCGASVQYTGMPTADYLIVDQSGESILIIHKDCTVEASETSKTGSTESTELLKSLEEHGFIKFCEDSDDANENDEVEETEAETDENSNETEDDELLISEDTVSEAISSPESRESDSEPDLSIRLDTLDIFSFKYLLKEFYTHIDLINKATASSFAISSKLMEDLSETETFGELLSFLREAKDNGFLSGFDFTADRVAFTGFRNTDKSIDAADIVNTQIADDAQDESQILRMRADEMLIGFLHNFVKTKATTPTTPQKRVNLHGLKIKTPENEKFAFRTWLIRLGWKGTDGKKERNLLYKPLAGNTAFCTESSKAKWKSKWMEKHS